MRGTRSPSVDRALVPGATATAAGLADLLVPSRDANFLRACLLRGTEARDAWDIWCQPGATLEDPSTPAGQWAKTFAPILLNAIEREQLPVSPRVLITLRAWRLAESQRVIRYRHVLRHVLSVLEAHHIRPLFLNGVAVADLAFADPLCRHSHDIDLVVPRADADRVAPILVGAGYERHRSDTSVVVVHSSGLPVWLHDTSGRVPYYRVPVAAVLTTAVDRDIEGAPVRVASTAQLFIHACVQVLGREAGPVSARRVVDAWHLAEPGAALDWSDVAHLAISHDVAGPVAVMCAWLARHGGAVPHGIGERLARHGLSRRCDVAALVPVLPRGPRYVRACVGVRGPWRTRVAITAAMLAPDTRFMTWRYGAMSRVDTAMAYARRLGLPLRRHRLRA